MDPSFDSGSGLHGTVYAVVPAGEGKVNAGGSFSTVRGAMRNGIARLNADGTVDETFDPGSGADSFVDSIAVQPDGKLLVVSRNQATGRIARFNNDGSLDTSFNPGSTASNGNLYGKVDSIAVQADGKVLIGGGFTSYSGTERKGIARLNSDGSLDSSFNPGTGAEVGINSIGRVHTIAVQTDGKVLIGGYFYLYNGTPRSGIARLNGDGSLDPGFDSGTGVSGAVWSIALQVDGKMLIGGGFERYNGTARNRIARLNSDGSLDTSFNPGTVTSDPPYNDVTVYTVAVQTDGKVLLGGEFTSYDGTARNSIARLNSDGSLDPSFDPGTGVSHTGLPHGIVYTVAVQTDGKMLVGGNFTTYNGTARRSIARLNSDGSLDPTLNTVSGANDSPYSIAVQADGKVLIGGEFTTYNGTARNSIARLNSDGSLDPSFNPGSGANWQVLSSVVQADGKVLIGGVFTSYNGMARNRIARLNSDGSLDTSFDPGTGVNFPVRSVVAQADGKVLIGGDLGGIARLNSDGRLDLSFNPGGAGAYTHVWSIAVQPDGKILIGGPFTSYNGTARNGIARLNSDGSLDTSFNPGTGASGYVYSVVVQADGKVLIGGAFSSYNGTGRNGIARLNSNGSLDTSFNPGSGTGGVFSVALQADGKVLIGGYFSSYNGTARKGIARLNSNGSLDTGFDPGSGAFYVLSIALQNDGRGAHRRFVHKLQRHGAQLSGACLQ